MWVWDRAPSGVQPLVGGSGLSPLKLKAFERLGVNNQLILELGCPLLQMMGCLLL